MLHFSGYNISPKRLRGRWSAHTRTLKVHWHLSPAEVLRYKSDIHSTKSLIRANRLRLRFGNNDRKPSEPNRQSLSKLLKKEVLLYHIALIKRNGDYCILCWATSVAICTNIYISLFAQPSSIYIMKTYVCLFVLRLMWSKVNFGSIESR